MDNRVITCSGCNRHLRVVVPSSTYPAFNKKVGTENGLQPFCRECDWRGKNTIQQAWNKFHAQVLLEGIDHLWTRASYMALLGDDPRCHWCDARPHDWAMGHWIDRTSSIDQRKGYKFFHLPDNAVVCCWPCNSHKGHKTGADHARFIETLVRSCSRYPRATGMYPLGGIPWNDHPSSSNTFSRSDPPDLSAHVVMSQQLQLFEVA